MANNQQYPKLEYEILHVSRGKVGLTSTQIHDRIKKFYTLGTEPTRQTVWRYIKTLVERKEMFEDDSGYRAHKETKLSFKPMIQSHPTDQLKYEVMWCLVMLCDDPEDNGWRIKEIVEKRFLPLFNRMNLIQEVLETIVRSPELAAHMAHNEPLLQEMLKENTTDGREELDKFWEQQEEFGEYTLGSVPKEIP